MVKKHALITLICLATGLSQTRAQVNINGTLDAVEEFTTKYTVPIVMPDGVKLMTDVYLPKLQDSLTLNIDLGALVGIPGLPGSKITFIPKGAQIIMYDSVNGQPNPNPYQLPTVFTRTPYNKGDFDLIGAVMAILGYNYCLQDMRGRYSSEGIYFPMYSDSWNKNAYHPNYCHILDPTPLSSPLNSNRHEDGYHSVKFIQDQLTVPGIYDGLPHTNDKVNNGSIGMFGASALGNTQLQLGLAHSVKDSLPALKCLMPIVATTQHYLSTGYNNGTFRDRIVTGWLKGQIFSGTDDDLIPVDNDQQNSIHSSFDYDLPKTITFNNNTREFQQNKFEAANLSIDHFSAVRYVKLDGSTDNAGFYPNSIGRGDMDASEAPVNEFGESVDMTTQQPLPNLNYSRYRNLSLPVFHVFGWWDIFTEGQFHTMDYTIRAMNEIGRPDLAKMQKAVIGPWAHQTIGSRESGDRVYPKNVTDLTKIDLGNFSFDNIAINDIVQSDLITWFRYNLNYNNDKFLGEPKFILTESQRWQSLAGIATVRVPAADYKIPFIDMINFLSGQDGLKGLPVHLRVTGLLNIDSVIYLDIPKQAPILPSLNQKLENIPYRNFLDDVKRYRYYVPGPDAAADAAFGINGNENIGNFWVEDDVFPPNKNIEWKKMYLHANSTADFNLPSGDEGYKLYVHDPDDPILTVGGSNMIVRSPDGTRDSQSQMELTDPTNAPFSLNREGVIHFTTEAISDSFTIIGLPVCTLYAKSNPSGILRGPTDTDWNIRICDEYPDGRIYYVQEGIVNARARDYARALCDEMGVNPNSPYYYNGEEHPADQDIPYSNIEADSIYEYVFKMMPIGYSWAKGHKVHILINSSNYTRYQVNPNLPLNDGEFFRRKPGDGQTYIFNGEEMHPRKAVQRVHFSPEHPTAINFPVYNSGLATSVQQPGRSVNTGLEVSVFPNPVNDKLQIMVNRPSEYAVTVLDHLGRVVETQTMDDIAIFDVSLYSKGVYMAEVVDLKDGSRITKKFVVQ